MNQSKGKARPNTSNRRMSSSVSRGESNLLTGGTRDVNPQWLFITAAQTGTDTATTITTPLPVEKFGSSGNRARIVEILKVYFYMNNTYAAPEADSYINAYLSTTSFGTTTTTHGNSRVLASANISHQITTTGTFVDNGPICIDCTDGDGHGILVATDNVFTQVISSNTSVTNTIYVKVLYRFKAVGIAEYVGIVQSQQ